MGQANALTARLHPPVKANSPCACHLTQLFWGPVKNRDLIYIIKKEPLSIRDRLNIIGEIMGYVSFT